MKGTPEAPGLRLLGAHGRRAAGARGAVRRGRRPARPPHPPGALRDLQLADDPTAVRRRRAARRLRHRDGDVRGGRARRRRCGSVRAPHGPGRGRHRQHPLPSPRSSRTSRRVHQVSLYVGWPGEPQRELEMAGFDAFYERLRNDPELPSTSQPSIGDFLDGLGAASRGGAATSSRSTSPAASPAPSRPRARRTRCSTERGLGERVEVIDGETACGGMGLLRARRRRRRAAPGADKDAVVARVREARKALRIWFCLDTLEYLRRGGRVGKAQAWLGGTLQDQADPLAGVRDHAGRAGAHRRAAPSSAWSATPRSSATRAPTAGSSSTSRLPSRPSG